MDRLRRYIAENAALIETRLEHLLPFAEVRPETLHEAMRYSVIGGGKRFRPIMTLAAYDAAGGAAEGRPRAIDAGCAIELMHTYSLVHDDLPSMDNDTIRRNRLTTHKAFGEAIAILTGDALQALAFQVMAAASGDRAAVTVLELAKASGSVGMVGGQVLDLEGEGKSQVLEEIERIDRWKTGALFTCCCRVGALLADASDAMLLGLTEYGDAIGVMYQISDDIMDLTANKEKLGKTPGKDKAVGKLTYPAALGLEGARDAVTEKSVQAKFALREFDKEALYLRLLSDYLLERIA